MEKINMVNVTKPDMGDFIAITKALSDPGRVRALFALRNGELCVCQIIELLGLAPSTVSKHMLILKQAGLVLSRKEERWIYYRLTDKKEGVEVTSSTMKWVYQMLENDNEISRDAIVLSKITDQDLSKLCKMQRKK
jgi:ArsR family transcriptional regulator